ncbi:Helix-turn-helix domain-containing protein [Paenibacillus algorifonticola]|uniref:Helix-turn-helix domain-containing protein n=1 Tax=Paenibacillus algorifonticola TaxID=684063 RepID=A0A1I2D2S5_9BACL|nr:AraC family ligand binding domain-containing protein [Paenibacillus algorifonticola]SFE74821.1 Helix-turn-helix domain-containing protein [Paenibacillus algorifonticola]
MPLTEVRHNRETPQRQMELFLRFFGKEECEPLHSWGPGLRDLYIIHYVISGSGEFSTGGETYQLSQGQGFLITPGAIVHYTADEADPWVYTWIGFDGLHARAFVQRAGLSVSQPIFRAKRTGRDDSQDGSGRADNDGANWFDTSHKQLMDAHETGSRDILYQSILYRLIGELIECADPALTESRSLRANSKETYINEAITYIENNYSQKTTVEQIAQVVGLDRTYLSSLFKQQFDLSLQAFLLQFRMNRAVELLSSKQLSVSDISRSVGYTDPFLFSKMFKKVIGHSPRRTRELLEEEQGKL